jgi:hypothetical protein
MAEGYIDWIDVDKKLIPPADKLDPNDPNRWQVWSIADAAEHLEIGPVSIRRWIENGWIIEGKHYRYIKEYRAYRWDVHHLYHLVRLGISGRKKLPKNKSRYDPTDVVEQLKAEGWDDNEWIDLTIAQAAMLTGISVGSMQKLINNSYLEKGVHYTNGEYTRYAFHMGPVIADVALWRAVNPAKRRKKDPEDKPRRRRTKAELAALIAQEEGGYVPPAERQDRSDVDAILIQERAERGIARDLGLTGFANRPYTVPQKNFRKLTGPDLGDM